MGQKEQMKQNLIEEINSYYAHYVYMADVMAVHNHMQSYVNQDSKMLEVSPNFFKIVYAATIDCYMMTGGAGEHPHDLLVRGPPGLEAPGRGEGGGGSHRVRPARGHHPAPRLLPHQRGRGAGDRGPTPGGGVHLRDRGGALPHPGRGAPAGDAVREAREGAGAAVGANIIRPYGCASGGPARKKTGHPLQDVPFFADHALSAGY